MTAPATLTPPTRQEMFDRAVRGLRSQGFERCMSPGIGCSYADGAGKHCAWGWVDTSLPEDTTGSVYALRDLGIGIAALLSAADAEFAASLQRTHDDYDSAVPGRMEAALRAVGNKYGLMWPEEGTAP